MFEISAAARCAHRPPPAPQIAAAATLW